VAPFPQPNNKQFHEAPMRSTNQMIPMIVMTVIGDIPRHWDPTRGEVFAAPAGFCWRFVPDGPAAVQLRTILRIDARAVVVWVGAGDAIDRAAKLIDRLLGAGLPIVIAVAEMHDPSRESALRQAGALYICANEAQQRLCDVLESTLGLRSRLPSMKTAAPAREIKMDAS
jgi:hypothetical protein